LVFYSMFWDRPGPRAEISDHLFEMTGVGRKVFGHRYGLMSIRGMRKISLPGKVGRILC
jgi:hypothetical protein